MLETLLVIGLVAGSRAQAGAPPSAVVATDQDLFGREDVPLLLIEISAASLDSLRRDARKYVPATVREGSRMFTNVAVHLKGSKLGSFREVDGKPSLTLNFDKFSPGQRFYALDKIHLNNSVEDETYLAEALCGDLFRRAGVPAPRVTHVRLSLNGRERGVYVLKEGYDKTFLARWFSKPDGNFYEPLGREDITSTMDKKSGDKLAGQADLAALVDAAREKEPARRWERLGQVLDRDRFVSFLAVEVLTWHWDGYAMNKNNYRAYRDPSSSNFVFMPHGMDVMFDKAEGALFPRLEGLVAEAFLGTAEGRSAYLQRIGVLRGELLDDEKIGRIIDPLHQRLRPLLAQADERRAKRYDEAVNRLRDQIRGRSKFLREEIAATVKSGRN